MVGVEGGGEEVGEQGGDNGARREVSAVVRGEVDGENVDDEEGREQLFLLRAKREYRWGLEGSGRREGEWGCTYPVSPTRRSFGLPLREGLNARGKNT